MIETAIPLMGRGVAKKGTSCGTGGELVGSRGGQIRVAETPEDTKVGVLGWLVVE